MSLMFSLIKLYILFNLFFSHLQISTAYTNNEINSKKNHLIYTRFSAVVGGPFYYDLFICPQILFQIHFTCWLYLIPKILINYLKFRSHETCPIAYSEELTFWGISELFVEPCCQVRTFKQGQGYGTDGKTNLTPNYLHRVLILH